jgi:uncharacterized protein (TIGR00299 family) protein
VLAILDPFSGIAGDMFIGALIDVGLDAAFIEQLPATLGLDGVGVRIRRVERAGISATKVDFDIPPQPHGRHLKQLIDVVERSGAPASVKAKAAAAFHAIASVEASIHGTTVERVHLHEVGAVDAILDVVGSMWGVEQLGITDVRCGAIAVGDGFVETEHGRMPVPAPATLRLLEGFVVQPGPAGSGELTTPTGATLVKLLATGPVPGTYVPHKSGYGAGTKDFENRPNVLRLVLAEPARSANADGREEIVQLAADIDDATPEHLAGAADVLRANGALDVTFTAVGMKKGRAGTRIEVLALPRDATALESLMFLHTPTAGVRHMAVSRRVLNRVVMFVDVLGHRVRVKRVTLPEGKTREKAEFDDVFAAAAATGRSVAEVSELAVAEARRTSQSV